MKRIELEQVGFSLHDLLSETLQLLSPKAYSRGMEIELDVQLEMPDIRCGDPTRIRQVLMNLVSNAIKFTEMVGSSSPPTRGRRSTAPRASR